MKLRPLAKTTIFTPPTFVAAGTVAASTTSVSPGLPAGAVADDILIFMFATNSGSVSGLPTGYTILQSSGSNVSLVVLWKRHSGSESAQSASISPFSSGIMARMLAFRGCRTVGNPHSASSGSFDDTNQTALTLPSISSVYPQTMIVNVVGEGQSTATDTANFSGWTNAALASITEATDNRNLTGSGIGLGSAYGVLTTPISSGATTVTSATAKPHAYATFNLVGVAA